jgi:hypothetical protein
MIAYVLMEDKSDVELLKRLIPSDLMVGVKVVTAPSLSSLTSIATTLLVDRKKPLAIVVESKTTDDDRVEERRLSIEESLWPRAAGVPVDIILAVPSLEIAFFHNPQVLEEIVGRRLTAEQIEFARALPTTVLSTMIEGSAFNNTHEIIDAANPLQLEIFRSSPAIAELSSFLSAVQQQEKAVSAVRP